MGVANIGDPLFVVWYWMEITFSEGIHCCYMEPSGGGLGDAAVLQRGAWGKTPPILRTHQACNPPKSLGDNPHPKLPIVVSSIGTCQRVLHCPPFHSDRASLFTHFSSKTPQTRTNHHKQRTQRRHRLHTIILKLPKLPNNPEGSH
jgi:hypothetical protein